MLLLKVWIINYNNYLVKVKKICCSKFLENCGVTAYLLSLPLGSPIPNKYWQELNIDERSRALRFKRAADRVRFVITRVTLKYLLAENLDIPIAAIELTKNKFGKPMLSEQLICRSYLQFNVAHSGDKALIVMSTQGLVGADIETLHSFKKESNNIQSYIYSDEELGQEMNEHALNIIPVSQTWVMKEAVVKAAGCGLYQDMTTFSIVQDIQDESKFMLKDGPFTWSKTIIWSFSCDKHYASAIAFMPAPYSIYQL